MARDLFSAPAVEVVDLVKTYPRSTVNAVDSIGFQVARGEVFGLLGPNGAGKSTTVGILTTRVRLTSGVARVGGVDVGADPVGARTVLGVVPQRNNLDRSLTIRQNLLFHAAYHGVPRPVRASRASQLLDDFALSERADEKPERFSGGQEQRVMIARALMHAPEVLFLDEPSTGLDPAARLFVWDRVRSLRETGVTVVLTTHDMDEATSLADRVAIIDRGRVLALDTPAALTRSLAASTTLEVAVGPGSAEREAHAQPLDPDEVLPALGRLPDVDRIEQVHTGGTGPVGSPDESSTVTARLYVRGDAVLMVPAVAQVLAGMDARLLGVTLSEPSLEDVFIRLTGRRLR
ncbi:MAG: ABC transporter ATP-binding protein [Actinomycetes bacterium]